MRRPRWPAASAAEFGEAFLDPARLDVGGAAVRGDLDKQIQAPACCAIAVARPSSASSVPVVTAWNLLVWTNRCSAVACAADG